MAALTWLKAIPWLWVGPVLVALVVSWVCLVFRYRHKGRPFASPSSAACALVTIGWTGGIAAGVMLGAVRLEPAVPFTVGVALPPYMLLAAAGIKRLAVPDSSLEDSPWYKAATLGVTVFLDALDRKVRAARARWCNERINENWTVRQIQNAADRVVDQLTGQDDGLTTDLGSDLDAVDQAVGRYEAATTQRERNKARSYARSSLRRMLERAWDWGYTDISVTSRSRSPGARPPQASGR